MTLEPWQEAGFGLYVHWPFCQAKCPYCDFNSHVTGEIDVAAWIKAYLLEIDRVASETPGRVLSSVFFGGGTPSLMPGEVVAEILDAVGRAWTPANDFEVTLEANPGSVDRPRFRDYHAAGVSRLSLGVQSLEDGALRQLGRMHDAADARRAVALARDVFDRVSIDVIYARQDQSTEAWAGELRAALALGTEHLSLYQLTIEDGTAFAARRAAGGLKGLPGQNLAADLYALTQAICADAGRPAYEVSNHAAPGAVCRHNLIYWRGGDYLGIGPGAHGRVTKAGQRWATEAVRLPAAWLAAVAETGTGALRPHIISPEDQAIEYVMMSLRLSEGCDLRRVNALAPGLVNHAALEELCDTGHLWAQCARIGTTALGRPVLNAVLGALLT